MTGVQTCALPICFHLACEITEQESELEVVWLFRPQLFPQADVENLARTFESILAEACEPSETPLATLAT